MTASLRIGIDTGGTFTDVVRLDRGRIVVHKLPSTPDDPGRAVLAGIAAVRRTPNEAVDVVHGTTVGLNAVLQDRLPRTVFVTNRGFADLIEIGRQTRPRLFDHLADRRLPQCLTPLLQPLAEADGCLLQCAPMLRVLLPAHPLRQSSVPAVANALPHQSP